MSPLIAEKTNTSLPPADSQTKIGENFQPLPSAGYPDGVTTIDAAYVRPGFAFSHLLVKNGHAAFIDTGTTLSVPYIA